MSENLFKDVDCIHLRVADLDDGLAFYRDRLGLRVLWRTNVACGLGTENGSTEIMLSTKDLVKVDLKVASVEEALVKFTEAGGKLLKEPFDIDIGKCAVVADPWDNEYCILDATKGAYKTDPDGSVVGISKIE